MHIFKYQMLLPVNHLCFFDSLFAPEHEYNPTRLLVDSLDNSVAKLLPSLLLVWVRSTVPDCKDCIKQEYTLWSPRSQVPVKWLWHLKFNLSIINKSMIDLLKAWRTFSSFRYTERKTHRLIFLDIWVLTDNYNLQVAKLSFWKGIKD